MALVGYSNSEDSGEDSKISPKNLIKISSSTKPTFQKVIDRSNPHKIKVTLPEAPKKELTDDDERDGPPTKRVKVGGGASSGFNSLLPAPKRAIIVMGKGDHGLRRGGLGSGINLKTGATPGFSREPIYVAEEEEEANKEQKGGPEDEKWIDLGDAQAATNLSGLSIQPNDPDKSNENPQKRGNPMMFKPLSVARKPQKKKGTTMVAQAIEHEQLQNEDILPQTVSKVSMFSIGTIEKDDPPSLGKTEAYQPYKPLVFEASTTRYNEDLLERPDSENGYVESEANPSPRASSSIQPDTGPQSLSSVASDLNLSASAKRQLFGRQRNDGRGNAQAINVVNFNTDQEYAANELLRQAGEQVQHNPVRALVAGKHSLKQLVNAASNQKDALEEAFASGRRNKKEAGSKYGW